MVSCFQQVVYLACSLEGLHGGGEEWDTLLVALFEGFFCGGLAFDENDAGEFLERGDGHDVLMDLEGNPDIAHFGIAHHVAEEV